MRSRIAQISPANTAVGLTSDEPGADKGEPDKYYPSGARHYLRIVPKDTIQGAALATLMKEDGCTNTYILNDKEVYGAGLSRNIESSAKEQGLEVLANEGIDPKAPNFRSQAANMKSEGAECFVIGVGAGPSAEQAQRLGCQKASSAPALVTTTLRQPVGPSRGSSRTDAPSARARRVASSMALTSAYGSHRARGVSHSTIPPPSPPSSSAR